MNLIFIHSFILLQPKTAEAEYYADLSEKLWTAAGYIEAGTKWLAGVGGIYLATRATQAGMAARRGSKKKTYKSRVGGVRKRRGYGSMGRRTVARTRGFWDPYTSTSIWQANQKIHDGLQDQTIGVVTVASINLLNGIAAGDDYNQRDGRRVIMDMLHLRADFFYAATASAHPADHVRVLVVYDKQPNGVLLVQSDLFVGASGDSFYNPNNLGRLDILYDQDWTLPQVSAAGTAPVLFPKINRKIMIKRGVQYSGTTSAISSISSGALYLVTLGSQVSGANNTVLSASSRLTFHG